MVLAHDISIGKRTTDVKITQDVTFDTMLLKEPTMIGLRSAGFHKPSPIQLHGIPLGKCGFDLMLEAKSGTGKTAVFSVIALEKLDLNKGLQVIILAPTREIAAQICDVIKDVGVGYAGLSVQVVMGGLPVQEDIAKFKSGKQVHILVGSPGRLRHLIQDKHIDTTSVSLLVLDEADKLMEPSFQADINFIFSVLPKQKQVVLSSATYPESSMEFISKYVDNSQHICPDSTSVLVGISQKITTVTFNSNIVKQTKLRYEELLRMLTKKKFKQCLIFCNYQARVADLHKLLTRDKWPAEQLYGLQQQSDRLDALKTLQEYKCRILITTDLAARGIDASNVDLVVNFEPPYEWQTYLHRIGRAGRYGSFGTAVTIVSQGKEETKFKDMLAGMKDSINLCDMWSDSKYVINNIKKNGNHLDAKSKPAAPDLVENSNIHDPKKIWKEINNLDAESKPAATDLVENNNIHDFKELWKEIIGPAEGSIEIETFDELLDSFEQATDEVQADHSLPSNDYNTINIKLENMQVQDYLKHLKFETKFTSIEHQSTEQNEKVRVPLNCSQLENSINVANINSNSKNDVTPYRISSHSKIINECKQRDENYNEESEMLRLGLPTSFWSKQDRKKHEKNKFKEESFTYLGKLNDQSNPCKEVNNNHNTNTTFDQLKDKHSSCKSDRTQRKSVNEEKTKNNHKETHLKKAPMPVFENSQNNILETPELLQKNTAFEFRPKTSFGKNKICSVCKAKTSDSKNPLKYTSNKLRKDKIPASAAIQSKRPAYYLQWFTQLRARTQQIEMRFYLEELSRL